MSSNKINRDANTNTDPHALNMEEILRQTQYDSRGGIKVLLFFKQMKLKINILRCNRGVSVGYPLVYYVKYN